MDIDEIRNFSLLINPQVEECFPFGEETFVYKIDNKIFLLMSFNETELRLNVKCEPETAIELRERYAAITPGYHMNKKHWNTLILDGSLKKELVFDCIKDSFNLVAKRKK